MGLGSRQAATLGFPYDWCVVWVWASDLLSGNPRVSLWLVCSMHVCGSRFPLSGNHKAPLWLVCRQNKIPLKPTPKKHVWWPTLQIKNNIMGREGGSGEITIRAYLFSRKRIVPDVTNALQNKSWVLMPGVPEVWMLQRTSHSLESHSGPWPVRGSSHVGSAR